MKNTSNLKYNIIHWIIVNNVTKSTRIRIQLFKRESKEVESIKLNNCKNIVTKSTRIRIQLFKRERESKQEAESLKLNNCKIMLQKVQE